jgi:ribosomal protein S28E/S33
MKLHSIFLTIFLAITILFSGFGCFLPVQANPIENTLIQIAESPNPLTYMTPQNANEIAVQIQEGEFFFAEILKRTTGNNFIATDGRVRVMYDRDTGRVVVINEVTGDEFYNYFFSEVDEGSL